VVLASTFCTLQEAHAHREGVDEGCLGQERRGLARSGRGRDIEADSGVSSC
jgi:hypothetical protein